jgi:hypothetical protein
MLKMSERQDLMNKTVIAIRDLRAQLQALEKRIGSGQDAKSLAAASTDVRKKISAIEEELVQVNSKSSEDQANYPTMLNSKLAHLQSLVDSADAAPTAAEAAVFADLDQRLEVQLTKWREVLSKDLVVLNDSMRKNNVPLVAPAATPSH